MPTAVGTLANWRVVVGRSVIHFAIISNILSRKLLWKYLHTYYFHMKLKLKEFETGDDDWTSEEATSQTDPQNASSTRRMSFANVIHPKHASVRYLAVYPIRFPDRPLISIWRSADWLYLNWPGTFPKVLKWREKRRIRRWWIWKNRNRKVTLTLLRYLENYTFLKYACISTLHTLHRLSFSVMLHRRCIRSLQMEKVQVKKQKRKTRIWRRWLQFVANEMHSRPENAKR